jgi:hypothetical protein
MISLPGKRARKLALFCLHLFINVYIINVYKFCLLKLRSKIATIVAILLRSFFDFTSDPHYFRPSKADSKVSSSAYSNSPPTGMPFAK